MDPEGEVGAAILAKEALRGMYGATHISKGRAEAQNLIVENSAGSATAYATSTTTDAGCYFTPEFNGPLP